jgi:ubiquitin-protein ligase
MATSTANAPNALRRRLLNDIAEIRQEPYPNIHFHPQDADITKACLILCARDRPLHLTVRFPDDYPLRAPVVTMDSDIRHPNVFRSYICSSILNTAEDWTPAYTLKGILIQLLSFFASDKLEQRGGYRSVDLTQYGRGLPADLAAKESHSCTACGFHPSWVPPRTDQAVDETMEVAAQSVLDCGPRTKRSKLFDMPDELFLHITSFMATPDMVAFAYALPAAKHMINSYDSIRLRELQCFCLKKSFMDTKLGIGVSFTGGKRPVFRSEFDLLSNEAYRLYGIRKSIQGVRFQRWLPLPLTRRHWSSVQWDAGITLGVLHRDSKVGGKDKVTVLYHFLNTIVVQFSMDTNKAYGHHIDTRSTLTHASEKAVDSYFALFHLLLCFATEDVTVIKGANRMAQSFVDGPRSKAQFPDLGHVLVAALISDDGLTENLIFHIIKEAILRNVVWMLDLKGSAMAELAYLEPSDTSDYRLTKTFEASRTSYRLLMFLRLFNSVARKPGKSLVQLREELFDTHGAPPPGTSTIMAQKIRKIHEISNFPGFLRVMGIRQVPSKSQFSKFLKRTIGESADAGYSCRPMTQSQLYMLRRAKEPGVAMSKEMSITPAVQRWYYRDDWHGDGSSGKPSFFPGGGNNDQGRRGALGRGRGRR